MWGAGALGARDDTGERAEGLSTLRRHAARGFAVRTPPRPATTLLSGTSMSQILAHDLVESFRIPERHKGILGSVWGIVRRRTRTVRALDGGSTPRAALGLCDRRADDLGAVAVSA
jgi:hypothetical protein